MPENNEIYDWLVIFFLHEDAKLMDYTDQILRGMEEVGTSRKNIVLLIQDYATDKLKMLPELKRLAPNNIPNKLPFIFESIQKVGDLDFNEGESWRSILPTLISHYPSKKKMLITFSHGAAFGIGDFSENSEASIMSNEKYSINANYVLEFCDSPISVNELLNKHLVTNLETVEYEKSDKVITIKRKKSNSRCKNLETLWISELAYALKHSLNSKKLDIILMANCNMQIFDSCWLLRNRVKYFIAPESYLHALSYNYKEILGTLNKNPKISAKALAKSIRLHFADKLDNLDNQYFYNTSTFFVSNLKYFNQLKFLFDKILKNIPYENMEDFKKIVTMRQTKFQNVSVIVNRDGSLKSSDEFSVIDLNFLLQEFANTFPEIQVLKDTADEFSMTIEKAVVSKHIGQLFQKHDAESETKFNHSGVGIYFPFSGLIAETENIAQCAYFLDAKINPFILKSNWDEFLLFYCKNSMQNPD